MLDVTAFPALEKGRPKKPEKPSQEKKWEEESGAKPREGLRRRCRQMARLLQNTDGRNACAWAHLGEKPSVVSKETFAMSEGGTAVQDVPVRQIQLQKSTIDGRCSFLSGKLGGKRNANLRLRRRAERRTRGRELQLVVASSMSALRFGNETGNAVENCGE